MVQKTIWVLKLAIVIMCNLLVIAVYSYFYPGAAAGQASVAVLSKRGSRGDEVRTIQTKLIRWGYLEGSADGVYGAATEKAVRLFQKKNGLFADGIAGKSTLEALGIFSSSGSIGGGGAENTGSSNAPPAGYSDSDYRLLARIISAESRGESYEGQVAVGGVIINRIKHTSFPNTIAGVVYQSGAFTAVTDGQINQPVAESCYRAARDAMNGWDTSGGAIYYFNPAKTSNNWMHSRPVIKTIGKHRFCR